MSKALTQNNVEENNNLEDQQSNLEDSKDQQ